MKARTALTLLAIVVLLIETLIYKATAGEPITPAYTPEQAQASALAVPTPNAAPPVSLVIVTVCNQVVGIVAADAEGNLHPLNLEGLGDGRIKSILARVPQRVVVATGCHAQPEQQPIF